MPTRIADIRCSQVDAADIPLLALVTALTERKVLNRLKEARGNTLVRNAFEDEWPFEATLLAELTVATARRAFLAPEIASVTGLGKRAISNRLERVQGNMLLWNAFPELQSHEAFADNHDDEDDDAPDAGSNLAQDLLNGRRSFPPVDLLGAVSAIAVRDSVRFIDWFAERLGITLRLGKRRFGAAHGRKLLRSIFEDRWPPERFEAISSAAVADLSRDSAIRSTALVRLIADAANVSPKVAMDRLERARGDARIETLFPEFAATQVQRKPPVAKPRPPISPPGPSGQKILGGRYILGRKLGAGTFGSVFEATTLDPPQRNVVVKIANPGGSQSLRQEIGLAYDLSHQNICSYKDVGTDPYFGSYLVLQHGGRSLDLVIEQRGAMAVDEGIHIVRQAAAGLDYAHGHDILHQDIKPGNILIDEKRGAWEVRVTDFGISLKGIAGVNAEGGRTVFASHPIGYTPLYSAPEQRDGSKARRASDQYSLALVFCSVLEGEVFSKPYALRRFTRLSDPQQRALQKALSESPEQRFGSCTEFVRALEVG